MRRHLSEKLLAWKDSPFRKPLILKGIRQVGKTWLLKDFGRQHFAQTAYVNFEENPTWKEFFTGSYDVKRILSHLSIATETAIEPGKTLVILDEIQECPQALTALKYFCEDAPDVHVACAGSLLGMALAKPSSFPVGKVDFLQLEPMSFAEFLEADDNGTLAAFLESLSELAPIPAAFQNRFEDKLKSYFVTGGMPEVISRWVQTHDLDQVQGVLASLLNAFERDFSRHPDKKDFPKVSLIWHSVPSQLARKNKKFLYQTVKEGARAREYETALQWLTDAQLVRKVFRTKAPGLPLSAYDDLSAFKLFLADVGLLRRLSNLLPTAILEGDRLFSEFKGALTENYVLQALTPQLDAAPRYWSQSNPPYEVDFVIDIDNILVPVEIKADKNVKARSLRKYQEKFAEQTPLGVRFSLDNLHLDGDVLNIPLYMADQAVRLIHLALQAKRS